eukprot:scaffold137189_cov19-Tisochrysis_lutea.AAC.2
MPPVHVKAEQSALRGKHAGNNTRALAPTIEESPVRQAGRARCVRPGTTSVCTFKTLKHLPLLLKRVACKARRESKVCFLGKSAPAISWHTSGLKHFMTGGCHAAVTVQLGEDYDFWQDSALCLFKCSLYNLWQ